VVQVGLLFYLVLYWASTGLFGGVFVFPTERELLAKERSANMYRLSAYYISSTLCDTIAQIFYATVFYCIIYFMANFQRTASVFFLNLLGLYLVTITAQVSCISVSYHLSFTYYLYNFIFVENFNKMFFYFLFFIFFNFLFLMQSRNFQFSLF